MPAKRFNEADIDFDAIDDELAKLAPPKLSLRMCWTGCGSDWSSNRLRALRWLKCMRC